ncbi:kinase-like protein [Mucidula mucida]|nr:kinase-like protein [Mucidula mucida]
MLHMEQISYRYLTRRLHLTTTVATPKMVNVNYSPVISPSISSPQSVSSDQTPLVHRLSATSVKSLADLFVDYHNQNSYGTAEFATQLLACIKSLHIPTWNAADITPQGIKVQKVSGSMTNAVFFVSYPTSSKVRTLLLRIYGSSSGSLISRPRELHTLHILSSKYNIGPKVYGTFENGRLEEFFESTTLTANDMRDPEISSWIGSRMAEFHSVDIEVIEETSPDNRGEGKGWDISAKVNIKSWLGLARDVLDLPAVHSNIREALDLDRFQVEWRAYLNWLKNVDDVQGASHRVFAHNDAQYGNLLRRTNPPDDIVPHHQIIVVDFEYAGPNPATYDIANHFHEWTANYHGETPHLLDSLRYPTREERRNFYTAYIRQNKPSTSEAELTKAVQLLDDQVHFWSPASHAMWAIWGVVQAREDLENGFAEPEFDYLGYSQCRMAGFRREIQALGVPVE